MALVVVSQLDSDVGNWQVAVKQIMSSQMHAEVEEILEYRGTELLLEGFLQRTFVGTYHCRQLVKRWHFLIVGEDDALGIVYLVTYAEAEGLGAWQEVSGQEKSREAVDNLRFQVFGGLVA